MKIQSISDYYDRGQWPVCIYHKNCADGFGAAWVVWRHFNGSVQLLPAAYGDPLPAGMEGRAVFVVDFSYKDEQMRQLCAVPGIQVVLLDHHKTALEEMEKLGELDNLYTELDMGRSGARITWDWFYHGAPPPRVLANIEDRDLWRFALPETREVSAALFSYPYDMGVWNRIICGGDKEYQKLVTDGAAITRKHVKDIAELLAAGQHNMRVAGHTVPACNLPYVYSSEAGNVMAKGHPFAVCYWNTLKGMVFSLRSTTEGEDVAAVAARYGGGGHRNAAGFTVSREDLGGATLTGDLVWLP